ncbi:MAG: ATP:cob(I)alamin adenosyltransferase [Bacteroidales bacterium]
MAKIYTKSGDKGTTGIHGGERVSKDDIRIEANGTLDELNAMLGVIRAYLQNESTPENKLPENDSEQLSIFMQENSHKQLSIFMQENSHKQLSCSTPRSNPVQPTISLSQILTQLQTYLMTIMSHVATPAAKRVQNPNQLSMEIVDYCERQIDAITAQTTDNGYFILPGGTLVSAHLQLARTIVRRAERRLCTLHKTDPVSDEIMLFINRLSDLLFVMARLNMQQQNWSEEKWQSFRYKRK